MPTKIPRNKRSKNLNHQPSVGLLVLSGDGGCSFGCVPFFSCKVRTGGLSRSSALRMLFRKEYKREYPSSLSRESDALKFEK